MGEIAQVISTIGFPIASFLIAAYFIKYTYDKSMQQITELTQAVNNNTVVLTRLVEKMNEVDVDGCKDE